MTDVSESTQAAVDALASDSLLLLQVLCALAASDRTSVVMETNWADIVRRLGRTGDCAPSHESALALLVDAALAIAGAEGHYELAPELVASIVASTPPQVAAAVAQELASYWVSLVRGAMSFRPEGEAVGPVVLLAASRAVWYLGQLGEWDIAASLVARLRELDSGTDASAAADEMDVAIQAGREAPRG